MVFASYYQHMTVNQEMIFAMVQVWVRWKQFWAIKKQHQNPDANEITMAYYGFMFALIALFQSGGFAIFEQVMADLWDIETIEILEAAFGAPDEEHQLVRNGVGPNQFMMQWAYQQEW